MNITNFMGWFLSIFITIGTFMFTKLNTIMLVENVSMLDFIIALTIISIFINIILTMPQNINKWESRKERKEKARGKTK